VRAKAWLDKTMAFGCKCAIPRFQAISKRKRESERSREREGGREKTASVQMYETETVSGRDQLYQCLWTWAGRDARAGHHWGPHQRPRQAGRPIQPCQDWIGFTGGRLGFVYGVHTVGDEKV
jgi:hypothetical protein